MLTDPSAPAAAATPRGPRTTLWLLRVSATLFLLMVLCQPILAGIFLTGDVDAIAVHATIGSTLALVAMLLIGVTLAYVLGGRGRLWVLPVMVVLFLAVGLQIGFGFTRQLAFHIPLGVAIVVSAVLLAAWAWSPSARRPRGTREVRQWVAR